MWLYLAWLKFLKKFIVNWFWFFSQVLYNCVSYNSNKILATMMNDHVLRDHKNNQIFFHLFIRWSVLLLILIFSLLFLHLGQLTNTYANMAATKAPGNEKWSRLPKSTTWRWLAGNRTRDIARESLTLYQLRHPRLPMQTRSLTGGQCNYKIIVTLRLG